MIKNIATVFILLVLSIPSIAGQWTDARKVKKLYPHGDSAGLYVQLDASTVNPDTCGNVDWYFISKNNSMQGQVFALLLAAKKTGSDIKLYIDGCGQGRPAIVAAIEE